MRIAFVPGLKPGFTSLSIDFTARIRTAALLMRDLQVDCIVISGGQTRPFFATEASTGLDYLPVHFRGQKYTILEEKSRSTVENLKFTRELLHARNIRVTQLYLCVESYRIRRFEILIQKLWPEVASCIVPTPSEIHGPFLGEVLQERILCALARIDPQERLLFFPKKIFRNS